MANALQGYRLAFAVAGVLTSASIAFAAPLGTLRVAAGLTQPIFATAAPGQPSRMFIAEQGGAIKILDLNTHTVAATNFLTVQGLSLGGERGLLGLAFHPDYATNGQFFVNVTNAAGNTEIRRYQRSEVNPNQASPNSTFVLGFNQPQANHNGGWMGFGPDGYLYIASGDGGGANDLGTGHTAGIGNAQDNSKLLGKMLRIDVNGTALGNYSIPPTNPFAGATAGADEIWANGLRNPWRNSFDRLTGDLWIADVGQDNWEEINVQPAASDGGENYGWRFREGLVATPTGGVGGAKPVDNVDPIHVYPHAAAPGGGFSVTGGYVYRGPSIPEIDGHYFFADYVTDQIWSLVRTPTGSVVVTNRTPALDPFGAISILDVSSFGEDAAGNLYVVDRGGELYRIVAPERGDLNADRAIDNLDIQPFVLALTNATGYQQQFAGLNHPYLGDIGADGSFDNTDIPAFVALLTASATPVPEPVTCVTLAVGAACLAATRRSRQGRR
jgi:glucose/arabinose dehydrogenase